MSRATISVSLEYGEEPDNFSFEASLQPYIVYTAMTVGDDARKTRFRLGMSGGVDCRIYNSDLP